MKCLLQYFFSCTLHHPHKTHNDNNCYKFFVISIRSKTTNWEIRLHLHSGWHKKCFRFPCASILRWANRTWCWWRIADHLSGSWAEVPVNELKAARLDWNEELISHSVHNESEVNAESMFVLAFNIRAHFLPQPKITTKCLKFHVD